MSEKRKIQRYNLDEGRIWEAIEGLSPYKTTYTLEEVCEKLNEQQATITSFKDENLYSNFELKFVDDLKKLKDVFEICMILIDGAIANKDLELGYESAFQFERRIKKFNGD